MATFRDSRNIVRMIAVILWFLVAESVALKECGDFYDITIFQNCKDLPRKCLSSPDCISVCFTNINCSYPCTDEGYWVQVPCQKDKPLPSSTPQNNIEIISTNNNDIGELLKIMFSLFGGVGILIGGIIYCYYYYANRQLAQLTPQLPVLLPLVQLPSDELPRTVLYTHPTGEVLVSLLGRIALELPDGSILYQIVEESPDKTIIPEGGHELESVVVETNIDEVSHELAQVAMPKPVFECATCLESIRFFYRSCWCTVILCEKDRHAVYPVECCPVCRNIRDFTTHRNTFGRLYFEPIKPLSEEIVNLTESEA